MDIIVHCKKIKWDLYGHEDSKDDLRVKLPSSYSFKIALDKIYTSRFDGGLNIEESINSFLEADIANILIDEYDFCVESVGSFTWEWDPASCLKIVKKDANKVLKAWKKRYAEYCKGFAVALCGPYVKLANYREDYVDWMRKNIINKGYVGYTKKGYIGYTKCNDYSEPTSVKFA